eukprot:12708254-Alexandrium_andersonii.AAC.1
MTAKSRRPIGPHTTLLNTLQLLKTYFLLGRLRTKGLRSQSPLGSKITRSIMIGGACPTTHKCLQEH